MRIPFLRPPGFGLPGKFKKSRAIRILWQQVVLSNIAELPAIFTYAVSRSGSEIVFDVSPPPLTFTVPQGWAGVPWPDASIVSPSM